MRKNEDTKISEYWKTFNSTKGISTALSYQNALTRFIKDMGANVKFIDINRDFIVCWRKIMLSNLSKTTINIYLRAFAALLHEAYDKRLIKTSPKELFKGMKIYGKNSSFSRKHEFMPVPDWVKLWNFYETKGDGNEVYNKWRSDYKVNNMEATGLLLFMYLANGMNLRDLCLLHYDKYYFKTNKGAMRFIRHKTAGRTSQDTEFPLLPELRVIIERQGCEEVKDGLVFPYLSSVLGNEKEEIRLTALLNHVIRDRMRNVAKALGFPYVPTATWARHSFATNLIQSGVPKDYVAWAMGHADNSITDTYIAAYSHKQMIRNNSLLLHSGVDNEELLAQLDTLDSELLKEIVKMIIERGMNM